MTVMHKKPSAKKVMALWQAGQSERKIARILHTSRRQVINVVKPQGTAEHKLHDIGNLYRRFSTEKKIRGIAEKQYRISPSEFKALKKSLPHEVKEFHAEIKKGFYPQMSDKISKFNEHNFDFYIYGKYKKSEKYPMSKGIKYYQIGLNDAMDYDRFLEYKGKLKSWRAYDANGDRVTLDTLKAEYGF